MDNPNPIYYRDLITPDDSITKLMGQLDELITKYDAAKQKIQGAAAEMARGMQNVSGASEEQRKNIQITTEETEKLLAEYKDTTATLKALETKYGDNNRALREFAKIQKLVDEINTSAEGSYNRLSAQYRLNKIRLNEMSEAARHGTEAGRKLEAETKAIYEQMNNLQMATGKAQLQVGHYERSLGALLGVDTRVVSSLTDTNKALETMRGVFNALKGPIGLIIGAIAGVTAAVKLFRESIYSTQTSGDELDYAVGEWTGTWDAFKKAVASVDFRGFINGAAEAAAAGRDLKMVIDETFERTNSIRILRASMSEENAILQERMRDERLSYAERLDAANTYLDNMKPIYDQETETARRNADAQLEYLFAVTNRTKYATDEERNAAKEKLKNFIKTYSINEANIKLANDYLRAEQDIKAAEDGLRSATTTQMTEYYDNQRKMAQARINSATKETKDIADVVKQYNLTSNEQVKAYVDAEEQFLNAKAAAYNDQKRIVTLRNNLEAKQTKDAERAAKDRIKAAQDEAKAAEEAAKAQQKADEEAARQIIVDRRNVLNFELQSIQLQIAATQNGTEEMLQLRMDMINKQREIELFENQQKAENLRQDEKKIKDKYNALALRESVKFYQEMAKRDLAASQELAQAEFDILGNNEREKTLFRLEQEKARLKAVLELNETATEKMTETEIAAIQATIKKIEKEAQRTGYNNIYELLGINLDSGQQNALNTALNSVTDNISNVIDSWNKAADAAVKSADKQVEAAQKVLDAEIEARNNGYANDVATAQKELELAKSNQEKALKEREKAQKAQIALDAATQSSSLITASANIWKALSGVPVIGPALAITAITTMWGSFAAAKIKAMQVAGTEQYEHGTVELLQGGSHASGHDIDLGTKPDGTRRRAEGGEYFAVINKRNSRRYGHIIPDVINAFNNGTFADKYQRSNAAMSGVAFNLASGNTDVSKLEKDVSAIRQQGDQSQFVDGQGNTVIRYRNLTRTIKK